MAFRPPNGYIIDTSSFIDLYRVYPSDVFGTVWKNLEALIGRHGRARSPSQVLAELEARSDGLATWAESHVSTLFVQEDGDMLDRVRAILRDFPRLIDPASTVPEADPFVVALAEKFKWAVVTSERPSRVGEKRHHIPDACTPRNVECIDLLGLFRREGWRS